ncbi:hypothetical protein EB001_18270 [bacterium]|nr:hypothetical protein [bacterium]
MKLADRTVEVHSSGINSANQFTIAQTSKMFKILSDSLYSDKVMAVIRELSTNAYDSHISAKNPRPFTVKLPTAADPNFSVRDYGTGLSQKDMEHLYTTYGASNKNDSNDFVGCLGLGSKSPFAYTKSFTTTSYFNGTQYTYIAAIDDAGVPTLNLIHSCETNEPNGLEISFAVKQHDFYEFSQKAVRIFHYFKMKPTIVGGVSQFDFQSEYGSRNVVIDGEGWRVCRFNNNNIFPNSHHRINSGVIAIMGNIAYPVEAENLIGEEKVETPDHIAKWNRAFNKADIASWKSFVSEVINHGLYLELDFGIGELEMDVSREGLQYTKGVVKTLREKTQEIFIQLKDMFSQKIAQAKTKVEAISTYYDMNDLAGGWGVGAKWTDANNKTHDINSGEDLEYKFKKSKNLYVFNYRTAGYRSRRMIYLTDRIHHETLTGKGQYYWNHTKKIGKIAFFYCDIAATETAKKIVTKYCNQNDCFGYLLVDTEDHKDVYDGFDDLIADVGKDNIQLVSTHRDLLKSNSPRKSSTKGSKGSVSDQDIFLALGDTKNTSPLSYDYNDATYLKSLSSERLDDLEDMDEIVYIPILRYGSIDKYPEINILHQWKDQITQNKIFDGTDIYAIKQSSVDRLIKDGYNLVDFNTWLKTRLEKINDSKFKSIYKFNTLVEQSKAHYNSDDKMSHGYNQGYIDRQFLFHMLNMFGLDYSQYVNQSIKEILDSLMIVEFFADTMHRNGFDIPKFKAEDYYGHMTKLLSDFGINGLDSAKIKSANVMYLMIGNMLDSFYGSENNSNYKKIFKNESKESFKCPSMKELRNSIKNELDNNPLLKYIVCVKGVSGNLRELQNSNPIKQLDDDRHYYYRNNSDRWMVQMNDVDMFKSQVSKVIG